MQEVYQGVREVRGVLCDHWISTQAMGPVTMTLDWFFATEAWSMPQANGSRIPVQLVLRGTAPNRGGPPGNHSFYHVYDYTTFHVGLHGYHHATADDLFRLHCDSTCAGSNFTAPAKRSECSRTAGSHSAGEVLAQYRFDQTGTRHCAQYCFTWQP